MILSLVDLCHGGRRKFASEKRGRRALDNRDDDIDDQDIIPPFNPPNFNYTAPTWPTPSGLTEDEVTKICNKRIRYSKAGQSCGTVSGVDLDAIVNQCISDIKVNDNRGTYKIGRRNVIVVHGACVMRFRSSTSTIKSELWN